MKFAEGHAKSDGTRFASSARMLRPDEVRFERGTLAIGRDLPEVAGVLWDPRTSSRRLPAYRFAELAAAIDAEGRCLDGDLRRQWEVRVRDHVPLALRPYQEQALASWSAFGRRGIVALPTGAGKTRVALGAIFQCGLPSCVLCPTKALAAAWVSELRRTMGDPVGLVGDGQRSIERITVLTFESAYRYMDTLGDRFGAIIVDEVHHFGSGARVEALEACASVARLGLTATAPEPNSASASRLDAVIGPIVFEMGYGDLVGKHLAPVRIVRLPVRLEPDELDEYRAKSRAFSELRRTFLRSCPGADIATLLRGLGSTSEGRRALRDHADAVSLASFPLQKRRLVRVLLERHRQERTIVFTAFAENAYDVALDNLIPVIAAETSARERASILARFSEGRIRAVASARVLNEGIDVPEARVALVVAGALGSREHVQRIGRVLRPSPGKEAIVYELYTIGTTDERRARARASHAPQSAS